MGAAAKVVRPEGVFLGYCWKRLSPRPEWLDDPRVVDIASVSTCMAKRPEGWVERWDFNASGYYDTPEKAAAALAASGEGGEAFRLFAYEFFPLRFDSYGGAVGVDVASVFSPWPDERKRMERPKSARFLGYDPVQRWAELRPGCAEESVLGGGFGCSPLSCNRCSLEHPVNTHCLLNQWDDAVVAGRRFAASQGKGAEPGCYYVFGVYEMEERRGPCPG